MAEKYYQTKPPRDDPIILRHGNRHSSDVHRERSPEEKIAANKRKADKLRATKLRKKNQRTIRDLLEEAVKADPAGFLSAFLRMDVVQMEKALDGDTQAYIAVRDRVVGKPVDRREVSQDTNLSINQLDAVSDQELEIILKQNLTDLQDGNSE